MPPLDSALLVSAVLAAVAFLAREALVALVHVFVRDGWAWIKLRLRRRKGARRGPRSGESDHDASDPLPPCGGG